MGRRRFGRLCIFLQAANSRRTTTRREGWKGAVRSRMWDAEGWHWGFATSSQAVSPAWCLSNTRSPVMGQQSA